MRSRLPGRTGRTVRRPLSLRAVLAVAAVDRQLRPDRSGRTGETVAYRDVEAGVGEVTRVTRLRQQRAPGVTADVDNVGFSLGKIYYFYRGKS